MVRRVSILGTLALCVFPGVSVLAHGAFVDARPLPGVEVGGVVDEVAFLFPEDLVPGAGEITVTDPTGTEVPSAGEAEYPIGAVIRLSIEPLTEAGAYRVGYRVPALDGFIFEGEFEFIYEASAQPLNPLPYGEEGSAWGIAGVVVASAVVFVIVRKVWRDSRGGAR